MHELDAIAERRERGGRSIESIAIAVEPDQARGASLEQCARVTAEPHSTIDEDAPLFGMQMLKNLGGHDRNVRHQIPNSERARASSSVYASRCSFVRNRSWFQTSSQLY